MGNRSSTTFETRTVQIGIFNDKTYPDNRVISYKYTIWNFIFKNLFEQFRRLANFYFLCMGILAALIPDSPVSSWATLGPLTLVVGVSAAKQAYEDWLRHVADNRTNNSLVTVIRNGVAKEIRCKKVCVGDIVRVDCDGEIPCDLVMLISSHQDSKGYIMTANLDGETNLKTVECPLDTDLTVDHLAHLEGTITCDPPTIDLYQFHGNIQLSLSQGEGDLEAFNPAFVKDETPLEVLHGDSCRGRHRCSFSKLHFLAQQKYSAPLTADNLLLRGSRLRNTEYVFGCAVYTGQQTKLALNTTLTINKFSIVEKAVNVFLFFFFILLLTEVLFSIAFTYTFENPILNRNRGMLWYLGPNQAQTLADYVDDLFMYIVLYYYIIPISLYVTIEMQRFCGAFFFKWDLQMFCNNQAAICNTSDLNEELGQLQYLFSDKTGTLTENDMQFRRCSVEGSIYIERDNQLLLLPPCGSADLAVQLPQYPPELEQFLVAMAVCHSVQTMSEAAGRAPQPADVNDDSPPQYQASSPDEKALVQAAARCGVVYKGTEAGYISISVWGKVKKLRKLQILEFTSERKRMSIVVSDNSDQVWVYCKGAEIGIMPLVITGHREETIRHYTDFSMRGLRTLVWGVRRVDKAEYGAAARTLRMARGVLDPVSRDDQLAVAFGLLECHLHLQGATAVEDRLQPGVPQTLELLRAAAIKVWVLTGDKVETALNIAHSCGHFKAGTHRLDLIGITNETDCVNTLSDLRYRMAGERLSQYALMVDGCSVRLALRHDPASLLDIALNCTAVLCCRLSPKQKAELVNLVKRSKGRPIVAAVGDGANDVSMIQEANVGLGIVGKEGLQAVRCSDFAFARFQFMARAILVHGQWYYLRAATLVQFFFYKNIVFITPQVYFSLLNGVSPQPVYLSVFLVLYNTIFTAVPIIVYSLFEQNFSASVLLSRPELYKLNRNNRLMSWPQFIQWMVLGVWHSVVVYFLPALILAINPVVLSNNTPLDYRAFGVTILQNVVLVVNLKLLLHSTFWTVLFLLSVVLTIATFILFCVAYNTIFIVSSADSLFYVYFRLVMSPSFWLLSLLTIVLALLPDLILRFCLQQRLCRPQLPSWLPTRRKGIFVLPTLESSA